MRRSTTTRALAVLVALVAELAGLAAMVPAPATAEGEIVVTWPTTTVFSSEDTEYVVDVSSWDGAGYVLLLSYPSNGPIEVYQRIEEPGSYAVQFQSGTYSDGGDMLLRALHCNDDTTVCESLGMSPVLTVWNHLGIDTSVLAAGGPDMRASFSVRPADAGPVRLDWEVSDGGVVVRSGSIADAAGRSYDDPWQGEGWVEGHEYQLTTTYTAPDAPYGFDPVVITTSFVWDATPDPMPVETGFMVRNFEYRPSATVYPIADLYGDSLDFALPSQTHWVSAEVRSPSGTVVHNEVTYNTDIYSWDGLDESGSPLPEGVYEVAISTRDQALNVGTTVVDIRVSHEQLVPKVWRTTVRPDSVRGRHTCGTVKYPARENWVGSAGFRTWYCKREPDSWTSLYYRIPIPKSPSLSYRRARIRLVGGAAPRQPGSELYYGMHTGSAGTFLHDASPTFGPRLTTHRGRWMTSWDPWMSGDLDSQATVGFEVGVLVHWDGYRWATPAYDVKKIIVEVERWVLGYPTPSP